MNDFTELIDLASERLGGAVLWASDEFFAPKENLLKATAPAFIPEKYTEFGKWMDGWETRRHRAPNHDWCLIRLGAPGIVRGVIVDTAHFTGNFPEHCSLEGSADQQTWTELVPKSPLRGGSENRFEVTNSYRYAHLRFHIYPDGGVARLRVYGEAIPETLDHSIDLAAAQNGGRVAEATDMYFGSRHNLIFPGRSTGMHDGWETRRRRDSGHDWCLIELAAHGEIRGVEVDTSHFKGNFPVSCSLESADGEEILPQSPLEAHKVHVFENKLKHAAASRVRFHIYPDGGVSRLRIWGSLTEEGRAAHRVKLLNSLARPEAEKCFLACCGSKRWADGMVEARSFSSNSSMLEAAESIWRRLDKTDWLQAFSAHPRIGERTSDRRAAAEQSATKSASESTLGELQRLNEEYAARFGYIFIVFASGKSADEMLQLLRARLANDTAIEIELAAEEQLAITKARLGKIGSPA